MIEALHQSDQIRLEGIVLADTKYFAVRLLGTNNTVRWVKNVGGWTYNADGIAAFAGSTIANCCIRANDDSLKPYANNVTISKCVVWQLNNGGSMASWQRSFAIENVVTETPVPFIFNIRPNPAAHWSNHIECGDPARPFDGIIFDHVQINGATLPPPIGAQPDVLRPRTWRNRFSGNQSVSENFKSAPLCDFIAWQPFNVFPAQCSARGRCRSRNLGRRAGRC